MADMEADKKVLPGNAVHLLRTTQQIHVQLSAMADHKASILMGATFVIFTITIGQARQASPPIALLILGMAAFFAAIFAGLAVLPATSSKKAGPTNLLFFGSFTQFPQEDYIDALMDQLAADETIYRAMARDIYQNGSVLVHKKYRMLGYAYRIFLTGLTASFLALLVEMFLWYS